MKVEGRVGSTHLNCQASRESKEYTMAGATQEHNRVTHFRLTISSGLRREMLDCRSVVAISRVLRGRGSDLGVPQRAHRPDWKAEF